MIGSGCTSCRIPRALLLACAAAGALGLGCRDRETDTLVLGAVRLPAVGLVLLAERSGCFADERLDVRRRDFPTGRDALAAMLHGEVDVATAFHTPVVFQAFEHPELRVLTLLHSASRNTHIAARADRGIRDVATLRGKRIGVPRKTNAEFFVRTVLAFEGVELSEVTLVDIPAERASAMLSAGEVDAVAVWAPHVDDAAAALPAGVAVEIHSDVYMEGSVLATREQIRASRPRALTKLLRCLRRTEEFIETAPDGGLAAARQIFPEEDPAKLERQWREVTLQLGLSNALVAILGQEAEWLHAAGDAEGPVPAFDGLFAPEFLEAVHPDAVTYVARR
jgi:sulfonate transport system substrate-binding protein